MRSKKQNLDITLNSAFHNLNPKIQLYINDVITILGIYITFENIISIFLFGSQTRRTKAPVADCDLLIIVKDSTPEKRINQSKKYLLALEIKYGFLKGKPNIFNQILFAIQRTTGMFVSHFITKKNDFIQAKFHKIFSVNYVISKILAPIKLVLLNMIDNSMILYGVDLRPRIRDHLCGTSLIVNIFKSLVMNLAISMSSILLLPFKELNPIKYSLESVKWSIKSINYFLFHDSKPLDQVIERFKLLSKSVHQKSNTELFLKQFLYLRHNPIENIGFMLGSPKKILKLHVLALQNSKGS